MTVAAGGGTLATVFSTKNLVLDSPLLGTGTVTIGEAMSGTNAPGQVILENAKNLISGAVIIATNANLALVGNAGISNSPTIDVQTGGVWDVTARSNGLVTIVSGQTVQGNGVIKGNLNMVSGSVLAPGEGGLGILSVTNAATVTTLGGTTIMELNRASTPNSDRLLSTSNLFAGTLTVNNLGAALQLGDTFTLFTSVTNRGNFAVTNLPALSTGLAWSNSLTINGKPSRVSRGSTRTRRTSRSASKRQCAHPVVAGGSHGLAVAGADEHARGWFGALDQRVGIMPNSTSVNTTNMILNPTNGAVFYRLVYPGAIRPKSVRNEIGISTRPAQAGRVFCGWRTLLQGGWFLRRGKFVGGLWFSIWWAFSIGLNLEESGRGLPHSKTLARSAVPRGSGGSLSTGDTHKTRLAYIGRNALLIAPEHHYV